MRAKRAIAFGIVGAGAISLLSAVARTAGVPIRLELILGTMFGGSPSPNTFMLGLAVHLAIGGAFGLLYAWLMETVWNHGGASMGMILGFLHASLIGMALGLTPQWHPLVPAQLADPGPYFANLGVAGVVCFYAVHLAYGAIVGAGYGHVAAERTWAPAGRL